MNIVVVTGSLRRGAGLTNARMELGHLFEAARLCKTCCDDGVAVHVLLPRLLRGAAKSWRQIIDLDVAVGHVFPAGTIHVSRPGIFTQNRRSGAPVHP